MKYVLLGIVRENVPVKPVIEYQLQTPRRLTSRMRIPRIVDDAGFKF